MVFNWTCPHCNHPQVASDENSWEGDSEILMGDSVLGSLYIKVKGERCLNDKCGQPTVSTILRRSFMKGTTSSGFRRVVEVVKSATLIPESTAKPQPEYIPKPLRDDYYEACRIRDLSPKASATLARRCLQGMIRNFTNITGPTLDAEIKALKNLVDDDKAPRGVSPESVEGIDHVRKIGNFGAHMEKDINLIVDIEPDEAQVLIHLVETLFEEWYVARHDRDARFKKVAAVRADKEAKQKGKEGAAEA